MSGTVQQLKDDLSNVQLAKKNLISGKTVGQVTYRGRTVSYAEVSLPQLTDEENRLTRLITRSSRKRMRVISTDKGFF
jgi:hypothetical protein